MTTRRSRLRPTAHLLAAALVPALLLAGLPALTAPASATATSLALAPAARDFMVGETVFLRGTVSRAGRPASGVQVTVRARQGNGSWRTVTTARTNKAGRFKVADYPRTTTNYVARVDGASSSRVTVKKTRSPRTLAERRRALAGFTGRATTDVRRTRRYGKRVTYQGFRKGWLVQVGSRTSFVRSPLLAEYRRRDAIRGRLGAPVTDTRCRLMEGACVQRFQNGAIYRNKRARHKVSVAYGRTKATPIIAAALSQRGYREPVYRGAKYLKWQGVRTAWCGIFQAWASHASGSGDAIPRHDVFSQMVAKVRARGMVVRGPAVGRLAFIGPRRNPSHVALIVAIRKDGRLATIEGNMDRHAGNGHPRGVFSFVRTRGAVAFYAEPRL
jgi:hypothetical protein